MDYYINMGIEAITRPPRYEYSLNALQDEFKILNTLLVHRTHCTFPNSQGLNIIGSFYFTDNSINNNYCLIYLHGNSSCQLEGTYLIQHLLPLGINLFCFDFCGCGNSDGNFVSLGYFERDDVSCSISYLEANYHINKIFLWGRSMGAATSFLSIINESNVIGCISDSAFSSLSQLVKDLSSDFGIIGCFSGLALWILSNKIKNLYQFDIKECSPITIASELKIPIRIIHGINDDFIPISHSNDLYQIYSGENKEFWQVEGDHNTDRPENNLINCIKFICECFNINYIEPINSNFNQQNSNLHFHNLNDMLN